MKSATTAMLAILTCLVACKTKDPPPISGEWTDDFQRERVGGDYLATQDSYDVKDGQLHVKMAHNHPLWLRKKLPQNAEISFDVTALTDKGDIKVEAWGDGESYDPDKGRYTPSGYVFVMGGWNNTQSIIGRKSEHDTDIEIQRGRKVKKDQTMRWKIVRKDRRVEWFVDDMSQPFVVYDDPDPLYGDKNAYFGFNNWQNAASFDNLVIRPL